MGIGKFFDIISLSAAFGATLNPGYRIPVSEKDGIPANNAN